MGKRIITLTTDWGLQDNYAAVVKSKIYSQAEKDVVIIDITHQIPAFSVFSASFILKHTMNEFPEGTIHIVGVNSEVSIDTRHLLIKYHGSYFIAADNGIFSVLFDEVPERIIEINIYQDTSCFSFPSKEIFAKTAIKLINGEALSDIGIEGKISNPSPGLPDTYEKDGILSGRVMHIDNYSNIITNISLQKFSEFTRKKKFTIMFSSYELTKINTSYNDVQSGDLVALFNSMGLLEIAQNNGRAGEILGIKVSTEIKITLS